MVRVVKKPEERRREIVAAARSLFLSLGYEKTTMQHVMKKLHIAKGTTYHYFKSKAELLDAVIEDMVVEYIAGVKKALKGCKGGALEKMRALVTAGRVAPDQKGTLESLHRHDNMGMHARLLAVTILKLAPLYAGVISEGCKEGVFRVEHPLECIEVLLAGIQFMTDEGCYPWSEGDLERRRKAIPRLIEMQLNMPKNTLDFIVI